jgi:hypothetical protein
MPRRWSIFPAPPVRQGSRSQTLRVLRVLRVRTQFLCGSPTPLRPLRPLRENAVPAAQPDITRPTAPCSAGFAATAVLHAATGDPSNCEYTPPASERMTPIGA